MNILETITAWISGGVLIASVYHTALYFLTKNKLLGVYCRYLWSCTGSNLAFIIFYNESINDFNSPAALFGDLFLHLVLIAYCVFLASAFEVSSTNHRRLWIFYRIALLILISQGLLALYAHLFMSLEGNLFFLIPVIICNFYCLLFTIYSLYYLSKQVKTKFHLIILIGGVVNALFVIMSALFVYLFESIEPLFGWIVYLTGMFLDVIIFSIAMGYKFKENIDERLVAISKASAYQLTMYKAEIQQENEIAKSKEMERKRLSQDLHDDLANSIANAKIRIETEILKTDDSALKDRLQKISDEVTDAYQRTRSKSHEWHNLLNDESETSFKKKLEMLLEDGLPDDHYQKDITIDDEALQNVPVNVKIEMFYIIQELIINIQKHAHAHQVQILIYKDISGLVLQVTDDGKGFDVSIKHKSIGLQSIKNRVENLNGTMSIHSDKSGTTTQAVLPIS